MPARHLGALTDPPARRPHAQLLTTLTRAAPAAPVQVLDALGRVVLTTTAAATGTAALALPAGLASGVYMVRAGAQTLRLLLN